MKPLSNHTDVNSLKSDTTEKSKLCRLWPEHEGNPHGSNRMYTGL